MSKSKKTQSLINLLLFLGILVFVNVIGNYFYGSIDLTEEGRFTLTKPTKNLLKNVDDVVYVQVLLDGKFPAGFKRLQTATKELLDDFRAVNSLIEYDFINPSEGTIEEINQRREVLAKDGILPTNLRVKDVDETKELIIYPWVVFNYKGRSVPVNLLENEVMGRSSEVVLNNSVSLLEYKFANAIQKIKVYRKEAILFTKGHGELDALQTADLTRALNPFYNTGWLELDSIVSIHEDVAALIVAKPKTAFSSRDKFLIDQYVMQGGKVLWLIDQLAVNLDSLRIRGKFIPQENQLNLEDMLFRYGVKVKPNLVLDLECSKIPLVTARLGTGNQYELFSWYYHPVVAPKSTHPIVKNLDRINLFFPSTIDTFRTKTNIEKTILLTSSQYSRKQLIPTMLDFEILRYDPDEKQFNKGNQTMAVLLEGVFPSVFENKVPQSMLAGLESMGLQYQSRSTPTKMLVVSDGDVTKNLIADREAQQVKPLGFNQYDQYTYANKDFMINALEYLIDDSGVMEARSKEVKLRMLDTVRARAEKTKWQFVNIVLPVLLLLLFGLIYNYWRRNRFAK